MKNILLLGAGRSAYVLITYLRDQALQQGWQLTIADVSVDHLQHLALPATVRLLALNIAEENRVEAEIKAADLVISLLPASLHPVIARGCVQYKKHFITASYLSPEIKAFQEAAHRLHLVFVMEAGLDPGLDHMSAMAAIQKIKQAGGKLTAFRSYTGGLVAPESDTNPWHYKFSWNPRNVILAGQGTAKYLEQGQVKFIPYHQLFRRVEPLQVLSLGAFDGYANRDSLPYRDAYGLTDIPSLIRGTLRRQGFCQAWHQLVALGLTADDYILDNSGELTYRQFLEAFLPAAPAATPWDHRVADYLGLDPDGEEMRRIRWLAFPAEPIGLEQATPAQVLEQLLTRKWQLAAGDKDLVVMQHILEYEREGKQYRLTSSLAVTGDDARHTAMAKTVGLPVGIIAKKILLGQIPHRGVLIPTHPDIYEPVLAELQTSGIRFVEETEALV
jgi:saccharopine dehydrogenase-like NADP-dependent oxidoreductase